MIASGLVLALVSGEPLALAEASSSTQHLVQVNYINSPARRNTVTLNDAKSAAVAPVFTLTSKFPAVSLNSVH